MTPKQRYHNNYPDVFIHTGLDILMPEWCPVSTTSCNELEYRQK